MLKKPAVTQVPIHDVMTQRWSPRAYDVHKKVTHDQILALLEAARWAPSCYGNEPWRYIVCDKNTNATAWENAFRCLAEANQVWCKNVPILILVVTSHLFKHNGTANRWAQYDCGAASENLCLQAVSLGLVAHQMGGFNAVLAKEVFHIPEDFTCMTMIAVGYQAQADVLTGDYLQREQEPRTRMPLAEIGFMGDWGVGIKGI
jgi:nitroreductase